MHSNLKTILTILIINIVLSSEILAAELKVAQPSATQKRGVLSDIISIYMDTQLYDWKNDRESSNQGYQIVSPLTITAQLNNFVLGYRQAHTVSENKTPGQKGKVTTFSDAAFSIAYTFKELRSPVRVVLDYNLPSGKASLDSRENNVLLVDSYLTQLSQFGEGHNITSGINVTHAINSNHIIGLGIGYTFKDKFDPNSEVINDVIDPGNEINLTGQWQYQRQSLSITSGFTFTKFRRTQRNGIDFFEKGKRQSYNLNGIWAWPLTDIWGNIHANIRLTRQSPDKNFSGSARELQREAFNVNGDRLYYQLAWSRTFAQRHNLRFAFDSLKSKENDYSIDSINYDAGRNRTGYGVTYGYAYSPRGNISLTARRYHVENKAERAGQNDLKYTGTNLSTNLNYQF